MTKQKQILADDPRQAVQDMLRITEELVARLEIETNALATNDGTTFTMNEMDKEHVAEVYHQAADEFHKRLPEFKRVEKALIDKLNAANASLKSSTKSNLRVLEKIQANDA
ncbi:MAG: hypothetical protein GW903_02710 [Alphaproteobacteria bacterium]|nr:hypothetical protein [Alphaproteobacteria bacterium]NCQ87884.1 hypothetical protein [Alphaproteobacteria bacterium]NCT05608.1 hypothetical protein [Alphaproteobacteria bacterium]